MLTLTFFPSSFSFHSTMVLIPSAPIVSVVAGRVSVRVRNRQKRRLEGKRGAKGGGGGGRGVVRVASC